MSWVGKNSAAILATTMCIALAFSIPFSGAQSAVNLKTSATVTGTTGDNGWYRGTAPTVTLSYVYNGSGTVSTYYKLNNSITDTLYTGSFSLPDGTYPLMFYSRDSNGYTETPQPDNYLNLKVDTQAPILNLTIIGNKSANAGSDYYVGLTKVNLTASDNVSGVAGIQYSFDSVVWANYIGNITIPDGDNVLYYRSNDSAGNINQSSEVIKVFNPSIQTSMEGNRAYPDYITIWFTGPAGTHCEYSFNHPGAWNTGPCIINGEGNWTIYYRAVKDSTGDVGENHSMWYCVDINPPTIDVSLKGAQSSSGWYDSDVTVTINARDNGSIKLTEWSWDNSHWNTYTKPFVLNKQSSKTIYFHTFDMFDRKAEGSQFIYFAPGSYSQGGMSNSVWIDGVLYGPSAGPSSGGSPTGNPTVKPTATSVPLPTPELVPTPTPAAETQNGMNTPLAIGVLVAMLVLIVVAGIALYLFVLKPK